MTVPMTGSTGAVWASSGGALAAGTAERGSGVGTARLPSVARRADWPHLSLLELAALPTAVSCGRLHTKQLLWEWGLDRLGGDAETLVSELLTNALRASWSTAGAGLVALRLLADHQRLVIEVWDQSPADPQPQSVDEESESGRGFSVIEAFSHRWGYQRFSPSQKVVWCELAVGGD